MKLQISRLIPWVAGILAFGAGFFWIKDIFQSKKIPYPFEWFGIAVGLGLACWAVAITKIIKIEKPASECSVPVEIENKQEALQ